MLFSPACERNKLPILAVLKKWLPAHAQVLEIGSGSGQHAAFFCQQIAGLAWQTSERQESLTDLQDQLEALSPTLPAAIALDVTDAGQWPCQSFDAVFSANTAHIMSAAAVTHLLAGASRVLRPSGLLLLYGPFHDGGIHTAASNAAFDQHLRSLDPALGVRDAIELVQQAQNLGLELLVDLPLPANNRMLVLERR
jgi:SAM-dependent methyltransferase